MDPTPVFAAGPHWVWGFVGAILGVAGGLCIPLGAGPSGRALPGTRLAAGIFGLGLALAIVIVVAKGEGDSWADVLAPAVQTLLAAVVAAFGVTQILIAREATRAAHDAVQATIDQTEEMRRQTAAAKEEAEQRTTEAATALEYSRQERLDSHAPMSALLANGTSFSAWEEDEHGYEEERTTFEEKHLDYDVVLTYRFHLSNFGTSPIRYYIRPTPSSLYRSNRSGAVVGGDIFMFELTETKTLRRWIDYIDKLRHEQMPPTRRVIVGVHGLTRHVYDEHTLSLELPIIRQEKGLIFVTAPMVRYAVAYRQRRYRQ